ncbi:MAG: transporter substrate-binding domain-containing protein [Alphaproteobacteria bacterium]|nr:transporter substrate-binding domain-containing protein [Pseudomonadota bacterium]MCZ6465704.1 transporter substrate-binding domain-containing protein [Alphaproteobacteria bacterium]MCZ6607398.1 transporter substrate-binding domain-containing protein [Alphaproteobacteria bacterium]
MKTRNTRSRPKDTLSAWIFLTGLVLLSPRPALAAEILFVADDFPPYQYLTPDSEARGSSYEVVQAVFDRLRIPIQVEFLPWKRAVKTTKMGKATGVFSCGYKKERESFVHYSAPISYATKGVIVKKTYQGSPISALKDLHNVSVGAVTGFAANKFLNKAGISFVGVPEIRSAIPMLVRERFDALYLTLETGQFLAAEAGMAGAFEYIPLRDFALRPYHLCFSKKWPGYRELAEKFNHALGELRASGGLKAIYAKYR